MKIALLLTIFFLCTGELFARHGKGGVLTYEYLGKGSSTTSRYKLTVKHYIDCEGTQFIEPQVYVGIFDGVTDILIKTVTITKTNESTIRKTSFSPCIHPAPEVCYVIVEYITNVELDNSISGYILAEQECCRIGNIVNIQNSSFYGITNTNTIPGVMVNSSPLFAQKDTAVICYNSYFMLDFSATDADGDSLTYTFCTALSGGSRDERQPNPPASLPYQNLIYSSGYSGSQPLGNDVSINPVTGIISGTAPSTTGPYVIAVCVSEYRKGVLLGTNKKEVQVTVADCSLSAAILKPEYINCDNYSFAFRNYASSSAPLSYAWDFGVPGVETDTSSDAAPVFSYPDTGIYVLKMRVFSDAGCEDSTTARVVVYPGFNAAFTTTGSCYETPFQFTDKSDAAYGVINSWDWNFGDYGSASEQSPVHQYDTTGNYSAVLIVSSSKGCVDTASQIITVSNRPDLVLAFKDTLICSIDTLALKASGSGTFLWTSAEPILNPGSSSPLVFPKDTSTYIVTLSDKDCIASDSVTVNVLDNISVSLPIDTTICKTDSIRLEPVSNALQYLWTPSTALSSIAVKNPLAAPDDNIVYEVFASLGKCRANASTLIKVVPYPVVAAGLDTSICYAASAQLQGSSNGSSFAWTPPGSLEHPGTLTPVASPLQTTAYILTAYDTKGCPKPAMDTVVVTVTPKVPAFAGNDTAIVSGQPLQLHATGGESYTWSPATGLSNTSVADPVARPGTFEDTIVYTVRVAAGSCYSDAAVKVVVFKTKPEIFVPSAFTPNGDGINDVSKPVLAGMRSLESFRIYNRWGQLVFNTNQGGKGWDGTINGKLQETGTFVYYATGIDYMNNRISKSGTITLIR